MYVRLFAIAAAMVFSQTAFAQGYPTCAAARAIVQRQGAAVIHTAPHIYDRYVSDQRFCMPGEYTKRVFVKTVDAPSCFIGFVCAQGPLTDEF